MVRDSAAAQGSISAVFNLAIQYIYSHFDFSSNNILNTETTDATSTKSPSTDAFENSGVTDNDPDITKTSSLHVFPTTFDPYPVVLRVMKFQNVLVTGKACKFIVNLLGWPGVLEAIQDVGGWGPMENLSALLTKYHLDN